MISIPLISVATALVLCAVMARVFAHRPEKVDRPQKAEILKQLLALSEQESKISPSGPSIRSSRAPRASEIKGPVRNSASPATRPEQNRRGPALMVASAVSTRKVPKV
jgi:hypothetical protein